MLNGKWGGLSGLGQDAEGNWGYIPPGADTVIPFRNIKYQTKTVTSEDNAALKVTFEELSEVLGVSALSATNAFGVGAVSVVVNGGISVSGNIVTFAVRAYQKASEITITAAGYV